MTEYDKVKQANEEYCLHLRKFLTKAPTENLTPVQIQVNFWKWKRFTGWTSQEITLRSFLNYVQCILGTPDLTSGLTEEKRLFEYKYLTFLEQAETAIIETIEGKLLNQGELF